MVLALVQARCNSRRLPQKVIKPILGRPMVSILLERLGNSSKIDQCLVVTSDESSDQPLVDTLKEEGLPCFRGPLDDVLLRFVQAANNFNPTYVVRITGDCPLTDPQLVDEVIDLAVKENADYASNTNPPSFPDGLDIEVIRFKSLLLANDLTQSKYDREHVTPFIYKRPEQFKVVNLENSQDLSHERWTVDYPDDFQFIEIVFRELQHLGTNFSWKDVYKLICQNPQIRKLNQGHRRNEACNE